MALGKTLQGGAIMLKHKDHFHGSDLEKIEEIYHIKKKILPVFPPM